MWDRGRGGSIALFFVAMIPLAIALAIIIARLAYVTLAFK